MYESWNSGDQRLIKPNTKLKFVIDQYFKIKKRIVAKVIWESQKIVKWNIQLWRDAWLKQLATVEMMNIPPKREHFADKGINRNTLQWSSVLVSLVRKRACKQYICERQDHASEQGWIVIFNELNRYIQTDKARRTIVNIGSCKKLVNG